MKKLFNSDIDIDFGDRTAALAVIKHIPACIVTDEKIVKHNTGIYVSDIPFNPVTGNASFDYKVAEERGYVKMDFLNVGLYQQIQSEEHLNKLMNTDPDWTKLYDEEICSQLIHVGNHYQTLLNMPEPVDTVARLMMFLAIIRPAKRHLVGKSWKEVAKTVWDKPTDGSYGFKMSHSCAYSHLVIVNLNLITNMLN